ncbi:sulfite reductase (NADPH) hemoprotein beta-component [Entomortierella parvispora]|uniref:assimilatory sulfite reductase (NADPH) n=1 Tax=Entomortierella parvispora TaxID=205924 RepID=A0A9P3HJS7_9FUNG|nr:sulfite reductase (NADPH) hemoprotein beta-component [Entomortierella parvispora]
MVSSSVDALAQAAFASSESIFAVDSPSSHPSQTIERLGDKYTISNQSPAVTIVQANADPFHKVQESASAKKDLTSVLATSDVLLPAIPHLFKIASQRSAVVVHVETKERESENHHGNNSKGATKSGVVPSHADLMAVRQTGFAILTSDNTQTAFDLALVAQAAAVQTSTPFVNAANASVTKNDKVVLDHQKVAPALISELDLAQHKERQAAVSEISLSTLYLKPTPAASADAATDAPSTATATAATPEEIYNKVEELLVTLQKHTGRAYRPIEYQGPANPKTVVVSLAIGSTGLENTLQAHHADVGLIKIYLYRPWSERHFLEALPASVERVLVYEQAPASHTAWTPLFLDVSASFHSAEAAWEGTIPKIVSARYRGSGADLSQADLKDSLASDKPQLIINPSYVAPAHHSTASVVSEADVDTPYLQMLTQVFADRLNIENGIKTDSVWGASQQSPEFGYGTLVTKVAARARFAELVSKTVQDSSLKISEQLRKALTQWHLNRSDSKLAKRHGDEAILLLQEAKESLVGSLAEISAQSSQFVKPSHWLIGADAWAYDIANSGVHHVISSNADINLLILDTEPYTARTQNPENRKKDIGLYAMNYGSVFVASVAVYSSYSQVLHALIEADQFQGPSIVLAYLPRPDEENVSPITVLKETKLAVDTGYWPLYRWNPSLDEKGEEPFRLDSERIKLDLQQFLERENHLSLILQQNPDVARTLTHSIESEAKARDAALKKKAKDDFAKLMGGLGGPPVLILFGSDGSNGEGLAKRLVKGAKLRNLSARYVAMDDVSIEDLTLEKHVIFVVSTAGQGEFPVNAREFWKALSATTELGVSDTKFAVFGLGDSHYWPREEDAIFYNRPSKELHAKLVELGATPLVDLGLGNDQDADAYETAWAAWEPQLWESLGCKPLEGVVEEPKKSADDAMKIDSNYLRGTIAEGLLDETTGQLRAEADTKLTKFHGIYQQDDRDLREERKKQGLEKAFSFMVRVRVPGGVATPAQWLAMDSISDVTANGTLKLTTRQAFQFHGVLKRNLKKNIQLINKSLLDTIAACGDVNRNIMCNPNPHQSDLHKQVNDFATDLSAHLLPKTSAYREIWLDQKLVKGEAVVDHEPLYGPTYLPRKFKIVVAVPPNNDVDVFAHDLGYIAITNKDGSLAGFNVTVGGGMGMTHGNKKTYPRLADIIAFCTPEQAIETGEKVMLVQRDFGDRMNRKHARLKYTIDDRGIEWFKAELQSRLPFQLQEPRPFKFLDNADRYGWTQGQDKMWHYCCYIENGRVKDTPAEPHKTGLREIAKIHQGEFRLTPNQHLIIANVKASEKAKIQSMLEQYKLDKLNYTGAMLNSMACVAFPTCSLAMAESERYLPSLVSLLESTIEEVGLRDDAITIRMTGCPNGCARPYVAEIAFVGKAFGAYNVYLGGGHHGERLNKLYKESLTEPEIVAELTPMIRRYAHERLEGEHFGDFVIRAGIIKATLSGKTFHDLS